LVQLRVVCGGDGCVVEIGGGCGARICQERRDSTAHRGGGRHRVLGSSAARSEEGMQPAAPGSRARARAPGQRFDSAQACVNPGSGEPTPPSRSLLGPRFRFPHTSIFGLGVQVSQRAAPLPTVRRGSDSTGDPRSPLLVLESCARPDQALARGSAFSLAQHACPGGCKPTAGPGRLRALDVSCSDPFAPRPRARLLATSTARESALPAASIP
jgi:hypothetical protein